MMNEDDEEDDLILDQQAARTHPPDDSGPILIDVEPRRDSDANGMEKEKRLLVAVTCLSMGMFTGLLGPTFPFLARNMFTPSSSMLWLVTIKALGFLLGAFLSSYLYLWFSVCCLLGLSCLSISFGICSLPFTTDLTTFHLTSLTLGISLGIAYNGIDILTNLLSARSVLISNRWLHALLALGAILSTLLVLPSTIANDPLSSISTNRTNLTRLRRDIQSPFNATCVQSYCCYNAETNRTFLCQHNADKPSEDCQRVLSSCGNGTCVLDKYGLRCRTDQRCTHGDNRTCSIDSFNSTTAPLSTPLSTTHRSKPSLAESDIDDQSVNLFYLKLRSFFQSMTSIHVIYLLLAFTFFLLFVFYSTLAMRADTDDLSSQVKCNPLQLFIVQCPLSTKTGSSPDRSLLQLVLPLALFYLILSSIDHSSIYLTYLFGMHQTFQSTASLCIALFYLFGRLADQCLNYGWILLGKPLDFVSLKVSILLRLVVLFLLCFSTLFQGTLTVQICYLTFFLLGFLVSSTASLMLLWIERDFNLTDSLCRFVLSTLLLGEMIAPLTFVHRLQSLLALYFTIGSSLLLGVFLFVLYRSKQWPSNRSYRLLSTSMEMNGQETSDSENEQDRSPDLQLTETSRE